MPTTVSSGIVLTGQAGGNVGLAVLLTVASNVIAVFTIPLMLSWLANFNGIELDIGELIVKLMYQVLAPLVVGQLLRRNVAGVVNLISRNKKTINIISIYALVCLVHPPNPFPESLKRSSLHKSFVSAVRTD